MNMFWRYGLNIELAAFALNFIEAHPQLTSEMTIREIKTWFASHRLLRALRRDAALRVIFAEVPRDGKVAV